VSANRQKKKHTPHEKCANFLFQYSLNHNVRLRNELFFFLYFYTRQIETAKNGIQTELCTDIQSLNVAIVIAKKSLTLHKEPFEGEQFAVAHLEINK
jgi:hypothetical protein